MTIIVFGLPGSGKSTFAEALAGKISATYISSDQVRLNFIQIDRYSGSAKYQVYEEMKALTIDALNKEENVVVDATFYREYLRDWFTLGLPGKIYFIEIFADESVIRSRITTKRRYSEADFDVYLKIKSSFEPMQKPHLTLNSGLLTLNEMLNYAEAHLLQQCYGSNSDKPVNRR
ncbi:MAG: ATP-binding protein [Bacteroidia bacterium]